MYKAFVATLLVKQITVNTWGLVSIEFKSVYYCWFRVITKIFEIDVFDGGEELQI